MTQPNFQKSGNGKTQLRNGSIAAITAYCDVEKHITHVLYIYIFIYLFTYKMLHNELTMENFV